MLIRDIKRAYLHNCHLYVHNRKVRLLFVDVAFECILVRFLDTGFETYVLLSEIERTYI